RVRQPQTDKDTDTDSSVEDTALDDTGEPPPLPFNGCGSPDGERATGSWSDPIAAPWLPFVDRADTTNASASQAMVYDCAPTLGEAGGEVVYKFELPHGGYFRAEVVEAAGVDVDLHLLFNHQIDGKGMVTGCLTRNNSVVEEANLAGGEYWLVVDTYTTSNGDASPGSYLLAMEGGEDDVWHDAWVQPGVLYRHRRTRNGSHGNQTVDVLQFDPMSFDVSPLSHGGCVKVEAQAESVGAFAGINAGFFGPGCVSLDMVRHEGVTTATNTVDDQQRTLVWNDGEAPEFVWLDYGQDHTSHDNAVGSWPSIVANGLADPDPESTSSFYTTWHPRTVLGLTAAKEMLWVTVDGRSDHGSGLSLDDLADLMLDLGAVDAVNLDGGGSTTMFIKDCSPNGVVNHPSDNGGVGHGGARSVSDGLYLTF
ncbi:MAG: phosphodiester glycosidase family protein, partial [Proteobacteria bacterium]|nr:phosphodiester glycosidase family protein [Pseudomonadota bacterium]